MSLPRGSVVESSPVTCTRLAPVLACGVSQRDDPICLEMLQEDLNEGRTWLRLFMEGGKPREEVRVVGSNGEVRFRIPDGYLPVRSEGSRVG